LDKILDLFSILSDKTRLRILLLLMKSELCVCEIIGVLDMSQPRISRHLSMLKQGNYIKDRREGKWIYYKLEDNEKSVYLKSILSQTSKWMENDIEFLNDSKKHDSFIKIRDSIVRGKTACCKPYKGGAPNE
jgi:ArsR family transcriptional regulator, arsenate/arsenite/antimonite-responsive transcriptional repressor